jgi:hypothetical protein
MLYAFEALHPNAMDPTKTHHSENQPVVLPARLVCCELDGAAGNRQNPTVLHSPSLALSQELEIRYVSRLKLASSRSTI